ncbi:MAG: glycosyl hydrolase [Alphaproteobacteria bacterium]
MKAAAFLIACGFLAALGATSARADVAVRGDRIYVDGQPFAARGASGQTRLAELKARGATVVRTYGEEGPAVLAEAEKLGLKVIFGFWLEHPRRGFDYANRKVAQGQLAQLREIVLKHKDSPALLAWGLGNEVESELHDDSIVWPAIGEAARLVKSLDPYHPRMAVIAEIGNDKIAKLMRHAPDIDVLGVNSYGGALLDLPERVRAQGWTGPMIVTELGAEGQWQAPVKPWGAAVELTSTAKAARLRQYLHALTPKSAGQILFYWGQKQEVTPTWHSLFLPSGELTEAADVMAEFWGGKAANRAPRIVDLSFADGADSFAATGPIAARVTGLDPDGDALSVEWRVMAESRDLGKAGDAESVPPAFPGALRNARGQSGDWSAEIAGLAPGAYRLFVVLRDGKGMAATGNLPFLVR